MRDTQHLTGLLVDDGTAKRKKVAAVGGSYGGGQTWLLATVRGEGAPQYGTLALAEGQGRPAGGGRAAVHLDRPALLARAERAERQDDAARRRRRSRC